MTTKIHCSARADKMETLDAGTEVRMFGLVKAAQHNGKIGRVARPLGPDGRIGVKLGDGQVLAARRENLELVRASASADGQPRPRTLTRENGMVIEFDGSPDPNLLVLYHHLRDRAFDCMNAPEYGAQMLRYYAAGVEVVAVVPRHVRENEYLLVCLRDKQEDRNSLCELAFQCQRQFSGISMLVKRRCFVCHKPGAPRCACQIAFFCPECEARGRDAHRELCKLVAASTVKVEEESVPL